MTGLAQGSVLISVVAVLLALVLLAAIPLAAFSHPANPAADKRHSITWMSEIA